MSDMYEMSYEDPMSLPRKIAQMLKNQGLDRTTENIQELAYPKRLDRQQLAMTRYYYDQLFEQEARRRNKTTSMGGARRRTRRSKKTRRRRGSRRTRR